MDADAAPSMPLFPLRTVLFPDGLLPLQIFEPRYLDMIARQHRSAAPFGVVCLSEGSEVRRPAAGPGGDGFAPEAFHPVGTLARIDELQRARPGLLLVRCTGTQRFRVLRSVQQKFGLWVAEIEPIADDALVPVPDDLQFTREALAALLRQLERSADAAAFALRAADRWDDCGWLANRWCELLPIDAPSKQRLMAMDGPLLRLELVADTLRQMGLARPGA
jgi:Lon protease-like protein